MSPSQSAPRDCPCHSGLRYRGCCQPLHEGEACAAWPEALMRSRYAAFALGLGPYLVDTLAADHVDRSIPRAELARELSRAHLTQRFMGLRIHHSAIGGAGGADRRRGEVLFAARVFVQGRDHSFVELSSFVREEGGWCYAEGVMAPAKLFGAALSELTRATFLARIAETSVSVSVSASD